MKYPFRFIPIVTACSLLAGCGTGATRYTPQYVAPGELTAAYDNGFTMYADGHEIAEGSAWGGLTDYVHCVPRAREHAEAAESTGQAAQALSVSGAVLGVGSLGSLAGLAVVDRDPKLTVGILGAGVATAATGVILALIGRRLKPHANGHALDAMNHYNDALGSSGMRCPPR